MMSQGFFSQGYIVDISKHFILCKLQCDIAWKCSWEGLDKTIHSGASRDFRKAR